MGAQLKAGDFYKIRTLAIQSSWISALRKSTKDFRAEGSIGLRAANARWNDACLGLLRNTELKQQTESALSSTDKTDVLPTASTLTPRACRSKRISISR